MGIGKIRSDVAIGLRLRGAGNDPLGQRDDRSLLVRPLSRPERQGRRAETGKGEMPEHGTPCRPLGLHEPPLEKKPILRPHSLMSIIPELADRVHQRAGAARSVRSGEIAFCTTIAQTGWGHKTRRAGPPPRGPSPP